MSDDTSEIVKQPSGRPDPEAGAPPAEREPWATPRVLASAPFGVAQGPPDGDPDEAASPSPGYGPYS